MNETTIDDSPPPIDPATGWPWPKSAQPGYYAGYSTLSQRNFWDAATRQVVEARVNYPPPIRFFTPEESRVIELICEHILPQSDRRAERRIPILPFLDERLYLGKTPGYRFEDMPPDGEAYRRGLAAIEQMAQRTFGLAFSALTWRKQEELLKSIHDGRPLAGAEEIWSSLPVHRYWALLVQDCIEVYYAHPYAWDEIGFGGPAYPRPYTRLERGEPEPWEIEERRYEWKAPPESLSDEEEPIAAHREHPPTGQGGAH